MYQYFGGDDILKQLQQYDPNAKWTDTDLGGGEGGSRGTGKRLDFDITKMPTSKLPNGQVHGLHGLAPSNGSSGGLINPGYKWDDPVYGSVTDSKNLKFKREGIDKWAPAIAALIAMGGPAIAGALAGAGIGGAGLTGAVTGSGVGGSAPSWLTGLVKQGPGMMDKVKAGNWQALGSKGAGMTLSQLAGLFK